MKLNQLTETAQQYEPAIITNGSMGSYLAPPLYPSHLFEVTINLKRRKENRGSMNIDYALKCDYISPHVKSKIKALISDWEVKKPKETEQVFIKWVDNCIAHWGSLASALPHISKFYPNYSK